MSSFSRQADLSDQTQSLLTVVHGEAMLGCLEAAKSHCLVHSEQPLPDDDSTEDASVAKRPRCSSSSQMLEDTAKPCCPINIETKLSSDSIQDTFVTKCHSRLSVKTKDTEKSISVTHTPYSRGPMFYYSLHRRRLKNVNLPK